MTRSTTVAREPREAPSCTTFTVTRDPTPAPSYVEVTKISAMPSSAFHSDTKRFDAIKILDTESEATGNPQAAAIQSKASKTFSKAALNGNGWGGMSGRGGMPWEASSTTSRVCRKSSTPRRSPRDTSPRPEPPKVQRPSSAFGTAGLGSRLQTPKRDASPGPGMYEPESGPSRVKRSASLGFGASKRFTDAKAEGPDPGAYASAIRSAFAPPNMGGPSPAFGSRTGRELFSKGGGTADCEGGPGGNYNELFNSMGGVATRQKVFGAGPGSAAFASRSGRFERPCVGSPSPGSYNGRSADEIGAVGTRGTRGKSSARGAGGFGSSTARESRDSFIPRASADAAPGPGAYEPKPLQAHNGAHTERAGSSAFASKSSRMPPCRHGSPGPGMYETDTHSLAASASKSHNRSASQWGRAARDIEGGGKDEAAKPGPGAYAQDAQTFERSSLAGRGKMSAAFAASSYGRDTFLGL